MSYKTVLLCNIKISKYLVLSLNTVAKPCINYIKSK